LKIASEKKILAMLNTKGFLKNHPCILQKSAGTYVAT